MSAALTRYRVAAYAVGTLLLVLAFVAMPMKYLGDEPGLVETVGPVHGWLYLIYLILTVDLSRRVGWPLRRTVPILVAGTVPLLSFVAERSVTRELAVSERV